MIELREASDRREKADFLAPFLLKHSIEFVEMCSQMQKGSISVDASRKAFQDCVDEFAREQARREKDLETLLEDTNAEVEKFKEFIVKFKDHFTAENIENVQREGESLSRFRNVLHRRLSEMRQKNEAQLQAFRRDILSDERLNEEFRRSAHEEQGE